MRRAPNRAPPSPPPAAWRRWEAEGPRVKPPFARRPIVPDPVAAPFDSVESRVQQLRSVFDAQRPLTVGLEEEVMLLDPQTLDLSPCAAQALELLDGDARFKPELPA